MKSHFILLTLFVHALSAQESAAIRGRVLDPTGAAIPGVVVYISARSSDSELRATSNSQGEFHVAVPPGRYFILARARELAMPAPIEVVAALGHTVSADLRLELARVAAQVQVTAASSSQSVDEQAKALDIIDADDIAARAEFSVAEALRLTPGARVMQLGGPGSLARVQVRGLRPFDTSFLIDGFRFRDAASPQGEASAFIGDLMLVATDRIEVLRGSGSSLYGTNAEAGAINLVTDPGGGRTRGEIAAEGGGLGMARGLARLAGGTASNRLRFSGGVAHLNITRGVDGDDRYRSSAAHGSAQFDLAPALTMHGRLFANDSFAGLNSSPFAAAVLPQSTIVPAVAGVTYTPAPNDPDARRSSSFLSGVAGLTHRLGTSALWRVTYQGLSTSRDNRDGPAGTRFNPLFANSNRFDGRIDTVQARADWHAGRMHHITGGYEWEREFFDNHSTDENPVAARRTDARLKIVERSHAVYLQDQMRFFAERLMVSLSGRTQGFEIDLPEFAGGAPLYRGAAVGPMRRAWTGDASLAWMLPGANTKLRAHAGNGYRAPALYERFGASFFFGSFSAFGDPRLRPERFLSFDTGLDQYLASNRVRLSGTYFYTRIQEAIFFDSSGAINPRTDPFGRFGGYRNTGGGLARGFELSMEAAPHRTSTINAAYTYTNSDERTPVMLGGVLRAINISDHLFSATATQRLGRRAEFTFDIMSASNYLFPLFDGRGSRAFSFTGPVKADLAVHYTVPLTDTRSLRFFTRIENLLNRTYNEDGFRTPKAWAVGGMRFLF